MGLQQNVQNYDSDSGDLSTIDSLTERGQHELDRLILPKQREELFTKIQAFVVANPKLSAFIATNLALSGIPLITFTVFTLSTAIFALTVGLLVAIGGAIIFVFSCAGVALLFLIPTLFFTTASACFLFCCGLVGYYLLRWTGLAGGDESRRRSGALISSDLGRGWSKEFRTNGTAQSSAEYS